jgi:hypothetical protein
MPTCIYCRTKTGLNEPIDHPVPQALGVREFLPKGTVCSGCNSYLSDLDRNFCNHHHIAMMIVFGGLPGTKGRLRKTVTQDFSFDVEKQHIQFFLDSERASFEVKDAHLRITHPGSNDFDEWKFSRALHRMALGLLTLTRGPEESLREAFDLVRAYVRQPSSRSMRPYYQRITDKAYGNRSLRRALEQRQRYHFALDLAVIPALVYINLVVDEFVVALEGDLEVVAEERLDRLALSTGLPLCDLSSRPWALLPFDRRTGEA